MQAFEFSRNLHQPGCIVTKQKGGWEENKLFQEMMAKPRFQSGSLKMENRMCAD